MISVVITCDKCGASIREDGATMAVAAFNCVFTAQVAGWKVTDTEALCPKETA